MNSFFFGGWGRRVGVATLSLSIYCSGGGEIAGRGKTKASPSPPLPPPASKKVKTEAEEKENEEVAGILGGGGNSSGASGGGNSSGGDVAPTLSSEIPGLEDLISTESERERERESASLSHILKLLCSFRVQCSAP